MVKENCLKMINPNESIDPLFSPLCNFVHQVRFKNVEVKVLTCEI